MTSARGLLLGGSVYTIWGLLPLFWKQLHVLPPDIIAANRVVCSVAFLLLISGVARTTRQTSTSGACLRRELALHGCSALLLAANWIIYLWAINNELMLASSLGYFMSHLIYVLAGSKLLKEELPLPKRIATSFGFLSILPLLFSGDVETALVSLSLAVTIVAYGLFKRQTSLKCAHSLLLDKSLLLLIAVPYLLQQTNYAVLQFDDYPLSPWWILLTGPATVVPLLLYSKAVSILPLSSLGILQHIAPVLQMLIGVVVYGEVIDGYRMTAFCLAWTGIFILLSSRLFANSTRLMKRRASRLAPCASGSI